MSNEAPTPESVAGPARDIMTAAELADYFRITQWTANKWLRSKETPFPNAFRIGGKNGPWRIPRTDVTAYARKLSGDTSGQGTPGTDHRAQNYKEN